MGFFRWCNNLMIRKCTSIFRWIIGSCVSKILLCCRDKFSVSRNTSHWLWRHPEISASHLPFRLQPYVTTVLLRLPSGTFTSSYPLPFQCNIILGKQIFCAQGYYPFGNAAPPPAGTPPPCAEFVTRKEGLKACNTSVLLLRLFHFVVWCVDLFLGVTLTK